jgi:hypothetical protein
MIIDRYKNTIEDLKEEDFRRKVGVKKEVFNKIANVIKDYNSIHKGRAGRLPKLSVENQLLMMFEYLRENRTYFAISIDFRINEANVKRIIDKLISVISNNEDFKINKNSDLSDVNGEVIIDCTEISINRPEKNQNIYYSGKKKDIQ